jgi:SAM-dependent methyltransferase
MNIYTFTPNVHSMESPRQVVPWIMSQFNPKSVLDVGCGIGTWLKAFSEAGIDDFFGVDGSHAEQQGLLIPSANFKVVDLNQPWQLNRKFDLAICLEVAEHLTEEASMHLVRSLTQHARLIIFAAAVPFQGGQNHINEQWPAYWQSRFRNHNFYFHDSVRPAFWNNPKVQWWYKQNAFVVNQDPSEVTIFPWIHPEAYAERSRAYMDILEGRAGILGSLKIMGVALKNRFVK